MSKCKIICVGDELVSGQVLNINAAFIAASLSVRGYSVQKIVTVRDDISEISNEINDLSNCEVTIITGGLGPTSDDITRHAVAQAHNSPLEFRSDVWDQIKSQNIFRLLADTNKVQAEIPKGFDVLPNYKGTAPGFYKKNTSNSIFVLPGPPKELKPMFTEIVLSLLPDLNRQTDTLQFTTYLIPEALLEESLLEMNLDIRWHTVANAGCVFVSLSGPSSKAAYNELIKTYGNLLIQEQHVAIEKRLFDELVAKNYQLGFGESCTGGLAASLLTAMPGSSSVFWGSAVTYANEAKYNILNVPTQVVERKGAVSEECAHAMSQGLSLLMNSSECPNKAGICFTGVAGPGGGSDEKPVGTVYISVFQANDDSDADIRVQRYQFSGTREFIQKRAVTAGFLQLIALIRGKSSLDILDIADYI